MNLAYNILWFENDEQWVDSMTEKLEDFFFDFGFLFNSDVYQDAQNLDILINQINNVTTHLPTKKVDFSSNKP
jgi:ribosomal protein S15P/S13E